MAERGSLRALDWFVFFVADVEVGVGPFVSLYLASIRGWNPAQIGTVLGAQSLASVLAQAPAGALIDHSENKPRILTVASLLIALCCLGVVFASTVGTQLVNQIAIGMCSALISPSVASVSLGLIGRARLSPRIGRNGAFSHSGNMVTALLAGVLGYAAGQQWIFFVCALLGALAAGASIRIRNEEIDNGVARGTDSGTVATPFQLLRDRRVPLFIAAVVILHTANAAMLPLAGQELSRSLGRRNSPAFLTACIVVAQLVMAPVALWSGRLADRWGRKPLYAIAFFAVILRGACFALYNGPLYIVTVELLDGLGSGIASVTQILILSDLARGTGRFNLLQGSMQAAVGTGAFLGNTFAGHVAKAFGFSSAFWGLALTAAWGLAYYAIFIPETRGRD